MTETIVAAAIRVPVPAEFSSRRWKGKAMYPEHVIVTAPPPARHHSLLHPVGNEHVIDHPSRNAGGQLFSEDLW